MKTSPVFGALAAAALWSGVLQAQGGAPPDSFPHEQRFITVADGVKLEVLDWKGTGRALILLAGLDDTAHLLDAFASRLAPSFHVYAVTRRGCGASSAPAPTVANYKADRLGDDVLAVIDALELDHPVLIGHSIAGEELSSVGSRHPEKVAGLVYLDAVWPYSYYDQSVGNMRLDALDVQRNLEDLLSGITARQRQAARALEDNLPQFAKSLSAFRLQLATMPPSTPGAPAPVPAATPSSAISLGWQKHTNIPVPILALMAVPHDFRDALKKDPVAGAAAMAADRDRMEALAKAFEAGIPTAHVVRVPNANHYIFDSNRDDVVREIKSFIASLP